MNLDKGQFWDITANAFRGCSKMGPGCDNCWALRMAWRHAHNPKTKDIYKSLVYVKGTTEEGAHGEGVLKAAPEWAGRTHYDCTWAAPLRVMRKRKRVFLNGMGDMFHEANKPADIQHCLDAIAATPQHLFIVATKRPAIALYHLRISNRKIKNLILLTSTEDQQAWDTRVPYIIECKPHVAAVGAIAEPLLGEILNTPQLGLLDWVIAGGETGPGARVPEPRAFEYFLTSCLRLQVPYFFKQFGGPRPGRVLSGYYTCNGGPEIWKTWC
jgi:protein gp37